MITSAICKYLASQSAITSLVSDRVNPNIIKEGEVFPSVYVSTEQMNKLSCMNSRNIYQGTIEIGAYANTYSLTGDVIEEIRKQLEDFDNTLEGVGLKVQVIRGPYDRFDDQAKMHVKILELDAIAQVHN